MADLSTNVQFIRGIGPQKAKALSKLGITTLRDLIAWFPRRYEDRTALRHIAEKESPNLVSDYATERDRIGRIAPFVSTVEMLDHIGYPIVQRVGQLLTDAERFRLDPVTLHSFLPPLRIHAVVVLYMATYHDVE